MSRGDNLIRDTIAEPGSGSAYELLKEMFRGYPIENLRHLLSNDDLRVRKAGVWILSELGEHAAPLIHDAVALLEHPSDYVRYYAMDSILVCATVDEGDAVAAVVPALSDVSSFNRQRAMWFFMAIPGDALQAAIASLNHDLLHRDHVHGLDMLLNADRFDSINLRSLLQSENVLTRRYAITAAARMGSRGREVLNHAAAQSVDQDIQEFASRILAKLDRRQQPPSDANDS